MPYAIKTQKINFIFSAGDHLVQRENVPLEPGDDLLSNWNLAHWIELQKMGYEHVSHSYMPNDKRNSRGGGALEAPPQPILAKKRPTKIGLIHQIPF